MTQTIIKYYVYGIFHTMIFNGVSNIQKKRQYLKDFFIGSNFNFELMVRIHNMTRLILNIFDFDSAFCNNDTIIIVDLANVAHSILKRVGMLSDRGVFKCHGSLKRHEMIGFASMFFLTNLYRDRFIDHKKYIIVARHEFVDFCNKNKRFDPFINYFRTIHFYIECGERESIVLSHEDQKCDYMIDTYINPEFYIIKDIDDVVIISILHLLINQGYSDVYIMSDDNYKEYKCLFNTSIKKHSSSNIYINRDDFVFYLEY